MEYNQAKKSHNIYYNTKFIFLLFLLFTQIVLNAQQSSNFYDVTKAGIKNDGSADVIEKLSALLKQNKNLFFPAGKYLFNGQLEFEGNNFSFKGEKGKTVFVQTKNFSNIILFHGDESVFSGINFMQTGFGDESNMYESFGSGITIYRGSKNVIEDCRFDSCGELKAYMAHPKNKKTKAAAGVYISGGTYNQVINCNFSKCIMGVGIDDYKNFKVTDARRFQVNFNKISGNNFEDCWKGIAYDFSSADGGKGLGGDLITKNTFVRNSTGDKAILLSLNYNTDSIIIDNNIFTGRFPDAIGVVNGSRYIRISNNKITGAYSGVTIFSKGPYNRYILINNNEIKNSVFSAVTLSSSGSVYIHDNTLSNNKTSISLSNYSDSVSIKNNVINKILGNGININNVVNVAINDNKLSFNDSLNSSKNGILVIGAIKSNMQIANNHFESVNSQKDTKSLTSNLGSNSKVAGIRIQTKDKLHVVNFSQLTSSNTFNGVSADGQLPAGRNQ